MQKPTYIPVHIRALAANEPFMSRIGELLDANFDDKKVDKICREMVRYYFDLKEQTDSHKIDALIGAINIIAIKPTAEVDLIHQAEIALANAFPSEDPNNFKELMKDVAINVEEKRPYLIPKQSPPPLPPLPAKLSTVQKENTRPTPPTERRSEPKNIPYLAKYTKEQSKHLKAINDIRVDGKFDAGKAVEFFRSQHGSANEAKKGFQKALIALEMRPALEHLDKLASRAIKTGDQEALRSVAGYVNELKDLISKKKSELEKGKEKYSVPQLQVAQITIQILERIEQQIEKVSQDCKMSIAHSDRTSRG